MIQKKVKYINLSQEIREISPKKSEEFIFDESGDFNELLENKRQLIISEIKSIKYFDLSPTKFNEEKVDDIITDYLETKCEEDYQKL